MFPSFIETFLKFNIMTIHHSDKPYGGKELAKLITHKKFVLFVRDPDMAKKVTSSKEFDKPLDDYVQLNFLGQNILTTSGEGKKKNIIKKEKNN